MIYLGITIICLIGIVKSSSFFISQSIALAKKLKMSGFVIGFTIVALGTSLPELIVSLYSTYSGHTAIAVSNVLGSNIANLTLVLGVLAIYRSYKLSKSDVFYNIPFNLLALSLFITIVFLTNYKLNAIGGIILLLIFFFSQIIEGKNNHVIVVKSNAKFKPLIFIISLFTLVICGKLGVDSVVEFAKISHISESFLGNFIIATSTSMPELIASFTAIKKGNEEIGIGNLLGSNMFNLFFILGASSFIRTIDLSHFLIELLILTSVTIISIFLSITGKRFYFTRKEGIILLITYLAFILSQLILK